MIRGAKPSGRSFQVPELFGLATDLRLLPGLGAMLLANTARLQVRAWVQSDPPLFALRNILHIASQKSNAQQRRSNKHVMNIIKYDTGASMRLLTGPARGHHGIPTFFNHFRTSGGTLCRRH
jgi:hypothetical protein